MNNSTEAGSALILFFLKGMIAGMKATDLH
jgi:hypothetical protein